MSQNGKILVVDDDEYISELIKLYLVKEGYNVVFAHDGVQALEVFSAEIPDLILLDIMLPEMDGWNVCKEIRKSSNVPIIMLSAKGENFDKVLGLELGADDYIVKPFDPSELLARVKAVLRRSNQTPVGKSYITFPGLSIDMEQYQVKIEEQPVELTPKEIELLYFIASHPNQVFNREQLLQHVWGYEYLGDSRTVDVHIKRIRKKVEIPNQSWQIKTVWGVGYKFEVS